MSSKRSFRITLSTDSQRPCFAHRWNFINENIPILDPIIDLILKRNHFVVKLPYNLCFRRLKKLKSPAQLDSFKKKSHYLEKLSCYCQAVFFILLPTRVACVIILSSVSLSIQQHNRII